jgi:hypothetical protein
MIPARTSNRFQQEGTSIKTKLTLYVYITLSSPALDSYTKVILITAIST